MNVDFIRNRLSKSLSEKFKLNQISTSVLDGSVIKNANSWQGDVHVFEFIIDDGERYFCFGTARGSQAYFTRAKEGIRDHLVGLIRPGDFIFRVTGDYTSHSDVVGKLVENRISQNARGAMVNMFASWRKDKEYDTTFGFNITRHHKSTMTFDSEFELLVKGPKDLTFIPYTGKMVNGRVVELLDSKMVSTTPEKIFI